MKIIVSLLMFIGVLFAQEVNILAEKFSANELSLKAQFDKNVTVTKGDDVLKTDKLLILFNKKKEPVKYEATGNASIRVFLKGKEYFGRGDLLIYEPQLDTYTINGNAFLEDRTTKKKIYGDSIKIDQKKGEYNVGGKENKPVKFTFEVKDKKKEIK